MQMNRTKKKKKGNNKLFALVNCKSKPKKEKAEERTTGTETEIRQKKMGGKVDDRSRILTVHLYGDIKVKKAGCDI